MSLYDEIPSPVIWDHFFLDLAVNISKKSRDPSTKVGAILTTHDHNIISMGYNGFPRGVANTEERWTRPTKYRYVVHAERNAIYNAAREGRSTRGTTMYMFYDCCPCEQCSIAIVQAGVSRLILGTTPFNGVGNGVHYDTEIASAEILREGGVSLIKCTDWKQE